MNQHDFKKLEFNPFALKKGERMVEKYPKLKQIKGFEDAENSLVKYVVILYDIESPLIQVKNLNERKKQAATSVNLKGDKDKIYSLEDKNALELVTAFLIFKEDMYWQLLCSAQHAFYEYNQLIMKPIGGEKLDDGRILKSAETKTKLLNDCDEFITKIRHYQSLLFGDEKKVAKKAQQQVMKRFTPEGVANV